MRCSQLAACRGLNRATAMTCCWAEPGNRAHHQWLLRGQDRKQQISTWASAQRRFRPFATPQHDREVRLLLRPFVAHLSALGPKSLLRDPSLSQTREISDLNQIADLRRP